MLFSASGDLNSGYLRQHFGGLGVWRGGPFHSNCFVGIPLPVVSGESTKHFPWAHEAATLPSAWHPCDSWRVHSEKDLVGDSDVAWERGQGKGLPLTGWHAGLGLPAQGPCGGAPTLPREHGFRCLPRGWEPLELNSGVDVADRYSEGPPSPQEMSEMSHSTPLLIKTTRNYKVRETWFLTQSPDRKFQWNHIHTQLHRENEKANKVLAHPDRGQRSRLHWGGWVTDQPFALHFVWSVVLDQ